MSKSYHAGDDPGHQQPMGSQSGYVPVPRWLQGLRQKGRITDAQVRFTYAVLDETWAWDRAWVRLKDADLATRIGVSKRYVANCREELAEKGILRLREAGRGYMYSVGFSAGATVEDVLNASEKPSDEPEAEDQDSSDNADEEADQIGKKNGYRQDEEVNPSDQISKEQISKEEVGKMLDDALNRE